MVSSRSAIFELQTVAGHGTGRGEDPRPQLQRPQGTPENTADPVSGKTFPGSRRRPPRVSRIATSIGYRIHRVWTLRQGTIHNPSPSSIAAAQSNPTRRDRKVLAVRTFSPKNDSPRPVDDPNGVLPPEDHWIRIPDLVHRLVNAMAYVRR